MFLTDAPLSLMYDGIGLESRGLDQVDYMNPAYRVKTGCFGENLPSPVEYEYAGQSELMTQMSGSTADSSGTLTPHYIMQNEKDNEMFHAVHQSYSNDDVSTETFQNQQNCPNLRLQHCGSLTGPSEDDVPYTTENLSAFSYIPQSSVQPPLSSIATYTRNEKCHDCSTFSTQPSHNCCTPRRSTSSNSMNDCDVLSSHHSNPFKHLYSYSNLPESVKANMLMRFSNCSATLPDSKTTHLANEELACDISQKPDTQYSTNFLTSHPPYTFSQSLDSLEENVPDYTSLTGVNNSCLLDTSTDTSFTCLEPQSEKSTSQNFQTDQFSKFSDSTWHMEQKTKIFPSCYSEAPKKNDRTAQNNGTQDVTSLCANQVNSSYLETKKKTKLSRKVQRNNIKDFLSPAPSKRKSRAGRKPLSGVFGICRQDSRWVVSYRDNQNKSRNRYFIFQTEFEQLTQLILAKRFLWRIVRLGRQLNPRDGEGLEEFVRNYDSDGTSEFLGVERTGTKESYYKEMPSMSSENSNPPPPPPPHHHHHHHSSSFERDQDIRFSAPSYMHQGHTNQSYTTDPEILYTSEQSLKQQMQKMENQELHRQPHHQVVKGDSTEQCDQYCRPYPEPEVCVSTPVEGLKNFSFCFSNGEEITTKQTSPIDDSFQYAQISTSSEPSYYYHKTNKNDQAFHTVKRNCITPSYKRSKCRITSQHSSRCSRLPNKSNAFAAKASHLRLVHSSLLLNEKAESYNSYLEENAGFAQLFPTQPFPVQAHLTQHLIPCSFNGATQSNSTSQIQYDKTVPTLPLTSWKTLSNPSSHPNDFSAQQNTFQLADQKINRKPSNSLDQTSSGDKNLCFIAYHSFHNSSLHTVDVKPTTSCEGEDNPIGNVPQPLKESESSWENFNWSGANALSKIHPKNQIVTFQCKPLVMNLNLQKTERQTKAECDPSLPSCRASRKLQESKQSIPNLVKGDDADLVSSSHISTNETSGPDSNVVFNSSCDSFAPETQIYTTPMQQFESSPGEEIAEQCKHPQVFSDMPASECTSKGLTEQLPASHGTIITPCNTSETSQLEPETHKNKNIDASSKSVSHTMTSLLDIDLSKVNQNLTKIVSSEQSIRLETIRCRYRRVTLRYFTPHGGFRYLHVDRFTRVDREERLKVCLGSYTVPQLKFLSIT